jgi:hypothetical protein
MRTYLIAACCLLPLAIIAQQDTRSRGAAEGTVQVPARDAAAAVAKTGTATLAGTVVTDEPASRPVRRAIVKLGGVEPYGGQISITDDQGRFGFTNLPAGRYMVTVSRPGFVNAAYGAKRPDGPGSAVSVADGQRVTGIAIRMLRGAVITGTVRAQTGEPAPGVTVNVMRYGFRSLTGARQLQSAFRGFGNQTDDRGEYRFYGLPPGEYLVLVTQGIGPVSGGTDVHQVTSADVQWATRQIQAAGQSGTTAAVPAPPSEPRVIYAPVFHPGTALESSATIITLAAGEERAGVDIPMLLVPTAKIEGVVTSSDGVVPPNLQINMIAQDRIEGLPFAGFIDAPVVKDNTFTFTGMAPGTYTITVRPRNTPAPGARGGGAAATAAPTALFAIADVTLSGHDTAVTLTLQPGVNVTGRVAFDGTTLKPPADLTKLRVTLSAVVTGKGAAIGVSPVNADATGAFTFAGVAPGRYKFSATVPGSTATAGWQPRSAVVNGRDSLDTPFDVGTDDVGGAVVTFSDHPAELSGTLQDAAGHPAPEYFVIVFSSDKAFWTPQSRRVQAKRPGGDSQFSFPNLPPGEYLVVTVTDVEQGEWYDPAFLAQLAPAAMKVAIAEGEKKVQPLKIAGR